MEKIAKKNVRKFIGQVKSAATPKTIVVEVISLKTNAKYHKQYKVNKKYHVHDEKTAAKVGDAVCFAECRPISKTKKWRLLEVITKK